MFFIQCDSPALWQTYLHDPANITKEGILIFNKHILFLLTIIVLFVGWLLFYTIYYYNEYSNKFNAKLIGKSKIIWAWINSSRNFTLTECCFIKINNSLSGSTLPTYQNYIDSLSSQELNELIEYI